MQKQCNSTLYSKTCDLTNVLFVMTTIEYKKNKSNQMKEYFRTEIVNYFQDYYRVRFDWYSLFRMKIRY